jgi:ABC-type sugar transport system ATPase subunit
MMVGRELNAIAAVRASAAGDVVLDVRQLSNRALGVREVSLQARAGEILGLAGLVGSGRTELAETLFGIAPATGGEVRLRGEVAHVAAPSDALRLSIAYLPEDRLRHGIVPEMAVDANVTLASLAGYSRWGLIDRSAERSVGARHVERLRVRTPGVSTPVEALSGGNPAEGRAGAMARDQAGRADPRRTDAGRGRRREGGDSWHHPGARGTGARLPPDFVGAARAASRCATGLR